LDSYPLELFKESSKYIASTKDYILSYFENRNEKLVLEGSASILHEMMLIKSLLWYPIHYHDNGFYLLALNQVTEHKEFLEEEIVSIEFLSKLVHIALQKINYIGTIKKQLELNKHIAEHDFLTQLPNRFLFMQMLKKVIKKANEEDNFFAVFLMDIDRFKEINDSLGHAFGDKLIKEVANRLKESFSTFNSLSRFGGDEFVLILESFKDKNSLESVAQKILDVLKKPIEVEQKEMYLTCSVGITIFPNDGNDPDTLVRNADSAMYCAKSEGNNIYSFYTHEMTQNALKRMALEVEMRRAIENDEFEIYYQPKIATHSHNVSGVEALIRWNHPSKGMIMPNSFIPLAEESSLIIDISKKVIQIVCHQLNTWHNANIDIQPVSINLPIKLLQSDNFITDFCTIVSETKCQYKWLEFEITESDIMNKPERSINILNQLNALGCSLAIDDFGTGYSSLTYLKRLPVDTLKIDRSFIKDIPYDAEDTHISKAVIGLAQNLGIKVVAEGVETIEQISFLERENCDLLQGFYFTKAVPNDELVEYLSK
jgi:diguanylate cyclase (GGDEF)-like protein